MTTTIKEYNELAYITTFDNEVYIISDSIKEIDDKLGKSRLLDVGNGYIAVSSIKKIEVRPADDVDNAIIQIKNPDLKERVRAEVRKRKLGGYDTNLAVLENIIERLNK